MSATFALVPALLGAALAVAAPQAPVPPEGPAAARQDSLPLLRLNQEVRGRLEEGDARDAEGRRYDDFLVRADAGRRIRVTARGDVDVALKVGPRVNGRLDEEFAMTNEDFDGRLDARVQFTLRGGTDAVVVRVWAQNAGDLGDYTVVVEEAPPVI